MDVLVTGGAGFIGSHTVEQLVADGHRVTVLDNLSSGHRSNLESVASTVCLIEQSVHSALDAREVPKVDAVVHLAAVPSVRKSIESPLETHIDNYETTLRLLEFARETGVRRFVFAGSAAVYGASNQLPINESAATVPLSPYGVDKLSSGRLMQVYRHLYGLETCELRFFNIYGPRQDPNSQYSGVLSRFLERVKAGESLTIYGDGHQTRDFVYVKDLCRVICEAVTTSTLGQVSNVCTGIGTSLLEVVEVLERLTGRGIAVNHEPEQRGDIRDSIGDHSNLKTWYPDVKFRSIEQGLLEMLQAG